MRVCHCQDSFALFFSSSVHLTHRILVAITLDPRKYKNILAWPHQSQAIRSPLFHLFSFAWLCPFLKPSITPVTFSFARSRPFGIEGSLVSFIRTHKLGHYDLAPFSTRSEAFSLSPSSSLHASLPTFRPHPRCHTIDAFPLTDKTRPLLTPQSSRPKTRGSHKPRRLIPLVCATSKARRSTSHTSHTTPRMSGIGLGHAAVRKGFYCRGTFRTLFVRFATLFALDYPIPQLPILL